MASNVADPVARGARKLRLVTRDGGTFASMRLVKGLRAERARWAGRIIATVDVVDCVTTPPWASESIHWALTKPRELTAAITGIDGKLSH